MESHPITKRIAIAFLALASCLAAGGCGPKGLYDWGSYDASVQALYAPPSDTGPDIGAHIQKLHAEIQATETDATANAPSRVPPGKYAQLGYLYALQGDKTQATKCFEAEKKLYPESTQFVDGMLTRMK
jgi:hypothetical protein